MERNRERNRERQPERAPERVSDALSVLQNVRRGDVVRDPYPFVVVEDAIPASLCRALIEQYPAPEAVGAGTDSNARWSLPADDAAQSGHIAQVWKDFTRYHASPQFFSEIVDVFGAEIVRLYPTHFPDEAALRRLTLGVRNRDEFTGHDLLMDAQIAGNTPVTEPSSVKTIHIDSANKLYTALLYLRAPDDDSVGGDLDIVRFRRDLKPGEYKRRYDGMFVDDALTEHVRTVSYATNVLVMFVNSPDALHGVTVRQRTPHRRLFLNLVGEVDYPLFDVPQHWQTRLRKLPRLAKKRLLGAVGLSAR
jgi:hypothetical protein